MREAIQVYEHEVLPVSEDGLSEAEFQALVRFNQLHEDKFFAVRHRSLKFSSFVGALQVGGRTIEILPKTDRASADDPEKWRNALIDMLRTCGYLKLAAVSSAQLRVRHASLFDVYMEAFLTEVQDLLHHGLVKRYRQVSGNIPTLKGRLVVHRQISENLVHRERFFTIHQHYDRDNRFNKILRIALAMVEGSARSRRVRGLASRLLVWMDGIGDMTVSQDTFQRLRFDRNTERYRSAIAMARLIILNYQPDIRSGGHDVLALLFDMNELFEQYVFRQVQRAATRSSSGCRVRGQHAEPFWKTASSTRHIRPDLLVDLSLPEGGQETVVLDTKWKVPAGAHPDDADLKQMYSYNLQFGATRSFLLYPRVDDRVNLSGSFTVPHHDPGRHHSCGMWFIDLFDGDRLRRGLGEDVLKLIRDSARAGS